MGVGVARLAGGAPPGGKANRMETFQIRLARETGPVTGLSPAALRERLEKATPGDVLIDEADVESYHVKDGQLVLTPSATKRLVANWDDFVKNDEGLALTGTYPRSEGRVFVVTLGARLLVSGLIAGPMTLYAAPPCPLLYPRQPMMESDRLVLGLGAPPSGKHGEDLGKAFVEYGPEGLFAPILGEDAIHRLESLGKTR